MSELPAGWKEVTFFDFCVLQRGFDLPLSKRVEGKYPVVTSAGIVATHGEFKAKAPGVVTGRSGSIGKVFYIEENYWPHNTTLFVKDFCGNHPKFVYHFLRGFDTEKFSASTAVPTLNRNNLRGVFVSIPPLAEQKRIADKLDALLARVDACRERLERVPRLLKRFRQAVLAAATSGALTEEWREDAWSGKEAPVELGRHCDVLGGKRLPKGVELIDTPSPYPYIRVTDFDRFSVRVDQLRYVPAQAHESIARYVINAEDIYISIAGTVGLVGQVPKSISGANLTENAARIVVRDGFLARYLMYQLASPALQEQMHREKIATTQDKLGLFRIKALLINKPPLAEQHEIVRRVEALFALADRIEARYRAARAHADKLTPALLAKAFRGELAPQDPNDEPAPALLARIRAEREAKAHAAPTQAALFNGAVKGKRRR